MNAHPKIGSQTIKKLLAVFDGDAEKMWKDKQAIAKIDPKFAKLLEEALLNFDPDTELKNISKHDIGYITMYDEIYPKQLKELYDCPAVLYVKGDPKSLSKAGVGVVGSRKYTTYGKQVAYKLSKECCENNLSIISGLALGIDTVAHQAAIDVQGITVGVLGCGLDQIYPQSNVLLARKIIEKNGAVVSEYPIGTLPYKSNFPARNRIIAGLSAGVLVVEAAEKSGALITAYAALEYNRDVFAIPGSIYSQNSAGTHKLIQQGAKLVSCIEDILIELHIEAKTHSDAAKKKFVDTKEEKLVMEVLSKEDKLADNIMNETGLNIIVVNTALTMLEMKGMVENVGGGRYRKIG